MHLPDRSSGLRFQFRLKKASQRLHRLEIDPETAPFVQRIFGEFVGGRGYTSIARRLTKDGILSPSGKDPVRNRHRASSRGVWGKTAVKAILENPRYTGYSVWAKQPRIEVLLDHDNVALGHASKQRWNEKEKWVWSDQPTHGAIVDTQVFDDAQKVMGSKTRANTRDRPGTNPYLLKGMVRCSVCERKMQGNQLRGKLHYRCVMKQNYPGADDPTSLSVREEHLLPAIDSWLATLFDASNAQDTCKMLEDSQRSVQTDAEELQARHTINECDQELANYRAGMKAAPSDTIASWIQETERRRQAAEIQRRRATTGQTMSATEIHEIVNKMSDIVAILSSATTQDRRRVYEAAQLTITYDHESRTARLRAAPEPGLWSYERVGGGITTLNPHLTRSGWIELAAARTLLVREGR